MDLMLSLSQHCSLEGGLAQRSALGCVAGGGLGGEQKEEEVGCPPQTCKGTNINLATVSNFL